MNLAGSRAAPGIATQTFWLLVAKTVGFILATAQPLLVVRLLDQSSFAIYRQISVFLASAYSILLMGMNFSAFYYLPRETGRRPLVVLNVLLFNTATGLVVTILFLFYPQVMGRILGNPALTPYARLAAAILVLSLSASFFDVVATAMQDVAHSTVFVILAQLSKVTLVCTTIILWPSVKAVLWALLVQVSLQIAALLWYLHKRFGRFWSRTDWGFFREQVSYAFPYGVNGWLYTIQNDMHNYFVSNVFGPVSFAVYNVGCAQVPLIGLLRESVGMVLIPRVSRLQYEGNPRAIIVLMAQAVRKLSLVYLPACACLMVVAHEFIVLLYTRTYAASAAIFQVNLLLLPMAILITDPVVRAYPSLRFWVIRIRVLLLLLLATLLWFATRRLGLLGAVSSVVAVVFLDGVLVCWRTARCLGMQWRDARLYGGVLWVAGVSALSAAVAWALRLALAGRHPAVIFALCGAAFGVVYVGSLFGFRVLTTEERAWIGDKFRRLLRK